jgi:hypothetical protein
MIERRSSPRVEGSFKRAEDVTYKILREYENKVTVNVAMPYVEHVGQCGICGERLKSQNPDALLCAPCGQNIHNGVHHQLAMIVTPEMRAQHFRRKNSPRRQECGQVDLGEI